MLEGFWAVCAHWQMFLHTQDVLFMFVVEYAGSRFLFDRSAGHLDSRLVLLFFVLQDLTLKHGWRTGAIIPELRKEIKIMNTEQYIHMMAWSQALTGLIEQMQVRGENECFFFPFVLFLFSVLVVNRL